MSRQLWMHGAVFGYWAGATVTLVEMIVIVAIVGKASQAVVAGIIAVLAVAVVVLAAKILQGKAVDPQWVKDRVAVLVRQGKSPVEAHVQAVSEYKAGAGLSQSRPKGNK